MAARRLVKGERPTRAMLGWAWLVRGALWRSSALVDPVWRFESGPTLEACMASVLPGHSATLAARAMVEFQVARDVCTGQGHADLGRVIERFSNAGLRQLGELLIVLGESDKAKRLYVEEALDLWKANGGRVEEPAHG